MQKLTLVLCLKRNLTLGITQHIARIRKTRHGKFGIWQEGNLIIFLRGVGEGPPGPRPYKHTIYIYIYKHVHVYIYVYVYEIVILLSSR